MVAPTSGVWFGGPPLGLAWWGLAQFLGLRPWPFGLRGSFWLKEKGLLQQWLLAVRWQGLQLPP